MTAGTAPKLAAKVENSLCEKIEKFSSIFFFDGLFFSQKILTKKIRKSIANGLHTQNLRISMLSLLELGIRIKIGSKMPCFKKKKLISTY